MSEEKKVENVEIKDIELGNTSGGYGMPQYTCVNPKCSQYLVYLQFQPDNNECPICHNQMGKVL